jgi:phosphohistidine swiveling domain-containing protein|tara:strand:- start:185 stop:550 length:366 start_codon:yes stop_codon:yes gene_type:complete
MPYPVRPPVSRRFITVKIPDISTAGQVYVAPGFDGKIIKAHSAIAGAIGTADADLTLKIATVAVTSGVITVATASSAAGDVDTCTPTALNSFTSGQAIEVETDGASTNTIEVTITLELEPA